MPKPAARRTLTEKGIAALKPVPGKRVHAFDAHVPGLAVRVTENGAKSFCMITRYRGKQKWVTLGTVGALSLESARHLAREAWLKAKAGEDPAAKPEIPPEPDSFAKIAEQFIEKYAKPRNRRWQESERIFRVYVSPTWGRRDVGTITRRDVLELLEHVAKVNGPIMANRVLAAVRKLFTWALQRDIVLASPVAGVEPVAKEVSRDRVLSDDELRAFWKGAGTLPYPWGQFYQLLALTGQRLTEVAGMRWADVDTDRATWTLPRELTKSDRAHEVPLSAGAVAILKGLPRFSGPYVFTSGDGTKHIAGFDQAKTLLEAAMLPILQDTVRAAAHARLQPAGKPKPKTITEADKAANNVELQRWTNHDLRRTFATVAAKLGIAPHVVEKALNHSGGTIRGVAAVYNRHSYTDEKRRALDAWASYVLTLVNGRADNVVPMQVAH